MKTMYKIDKEWFTKDNENGSVDKVVMNGRTLRIGTKTELWRGEVYIQGEIPKDQRLLKALHDMGKPYVSKIPVPQEATDAINEGMKKADEIIEKSHKAKAPKPKKKKVKNESKDISKESKEVSTEEEKGQ